MVLNEEDLKEIEALGLCPEAISSLLSDIEGVQQRREFLHLFILRHIPKVLEEKINLIDWQDYLFNLIKFFKTPSLLKFIKKFKDFEELKLDMKKFLLRKTFNEINLGIEEGDMISFSIKGKEYKLFCDDALNFNLENMGKAIHTDPPYGINYTSKNQSLKNSKLKNDGLDAQELFKKFYFKAPRSLPTIIWGYNYFTEILGSTNKLVVWDKSNLTHSGFSQAELAFTNSKNQMKVYKCFSGFGEDASDHAELFGCHFLATIHPTQKPARMLKNIFEDYFALQIKQGGTIVDPFAGSGSTLTVCLWLNTPCTLIELDPYYIQANLIKADLFCKSYLKWRGGGEIENLKLNGKDFSFKENESYKKFLELLK